MQPFPLAAEEHGVRSLLDRPAPPSPSTGCRAKGPRKAGAGIARFAMHDVPYFVTLPHSDGYADPVPLILAFIGRPDKSKSRQYGGGPLFKDDLGTGAVVVYLDREAPGSHGSTLPDFFDALYGQLLSEICVDTERVFAVGQGLGARLVQQLACTHSERLRGIAAVSGSVALPICGGSTAAILIHGKRDRVVSISRGLRALEQVLYHNHCGEAAEPFGSGPCVRYSHCSEGIPVAWCAHDETIPEAVIPRWPSFASASIADFFTSLQPPPLPRGKNLLANPADNGSWDADFDSVQLGYAEQQEGRLCAHIDDAGDNPWSVQLADHDLTLQAGQRYRIDVRLRASAPTNVRLKVGQQTPPYGEVWVQTRPVGVQSVRILDEFTLVEQPAVGAMAFALQAGGPLPKSLPVRVCLEHAWLSPITGD